MRKTQPTSLPSLPLHHPSSTGNDPLRSSAPTHEHFPACPFPSAPKPLQHRFPYFFSLDGRSPVSHPTCEVPFPPRRSGEYRKGMMPARPLYQGGCGSVWDPEPSKERVGDWGGPATVWSLLCVAERVPQGRTESGSIVLAANAGPRVPSGGVTLKRRCTYRPSVIYSIVNTLLFLSLTKS